MMTLRIIQVMNREVKNNVFVCHWESSLTLTHRKNCSLTTSINKPHTEAFSQPPPHATHTHTHQELTRTPLLPPTPFTLNLTGNQHMQMLTHTYNRHEPTVPCMVSQRMCGIQMKSFQLMRESTESSSDPGMSCPFRLANYSSGLCCFDAHLCAAVCVCERE